MWKSEGWNRRGQLELCQNHVLYCIKILFYKVNLQTFFILKATKDTRTLLIVILSQRFIILNIKAK